MLDKNIFIWYNTLARLRDSTAERNATMSAYEELKIIVNDKNIGYHTKYILVSNAFINHEITLKQYQELYKEC